MRLRIVLALGLAASALCILRDWVPRISSAATTLPVPLERSPETLFDIPYAKAPDGADARRQTLDLYLPRRAPGAKPPLLIFLHGGFWMSAEDDPTASSPAEALQANGVAVALVRYRLAPRDRHPAPARDAAAAVAHLAREAARYGFDRRRIFLAGHASGAHLAALVALDPSYLGTHRLDPRFLAGVIAISGIYDLAPQREISESQKYVTEQAFGDDPTQLKAASPVTHVRAKAPPFLILTAAGDFPGFHIDARKFADALRAKGNPKVDEFVIPDQDHRSIVQWTAPNNLAYSLVLESLNVQPLSSELAALFEAKRKWVRPPFSTLPFWQYKSLIRSYPFDQRFAQMLAFVYPLLGLELQGWPLQNYHAIDLFSYLDALPKGQAGRGDHLIIT
ncbi:MAG: alpha/beta hydrolase, partial [Candidatus Binatia bacterium]